MSEPPRKGARDRAALFFAIGWALFIALMLLWSSGFAGGIGPLFRTSPFAWPMVASVAVPIVYWLFSRAR